jgi:transmembrane sensor
MTKIHAFTSKETIQEQASLWVSKMDRGLSSSEKNEFSLWIQQSDFHQETVFKLASLWDDLSVLNELSELFPLDTPIKKTPSRIKQYAIAASVTFVMLFSGYLYYPAMSTIESAQQYTELRKLQTVVGQQASYTLSDGSTIKLNTNSLVKVNFSKKKRLLTLVRGEARFDVAKDKNRPFSVASGEQSFTALGTIFNVQKNTDNDMELVVSEGKVLVTTSAELLDTIAETLTALPKEKLPGLLVTSGEKAIISNNIQIPAHRVSEKQIEQDLAWQQGMLVFNGEPLVEALKEVSRYTSANFEIITPEIEKIKVAGFFKADDIDGLLQSLKSNFNINFEKMDNNAIHLSAHNSAKRTETIQ